MGANNSFKQLGKEEEEMYPHPPPGTEMGVMGNVRVFSFMSNVLELYLSRVFEMFVSLVGGTTDTAQDKLPFEKENLSKGDEEDTVGGKPRP